jgi:Uma2 family endonuclease
MSAVSQQPWTEAQFLDWAAARDARYEFDGFRPVAMTGRSIRHDTITTNVAIALRRRLDGAGCSSHGPNAGIRTIRSRIRYPDALITCTKFRDDERIVPDPGVVFEVVSPATVQMDRVVKVREYQAVPTIMRYVIVETDSPAVLVLHRRSGEDPWTATPLAMDDALPIPEAGIEIQVAELYARIEFPTLPELE